MTPAALRRGAVQARTHLDAPDLARLMEAAAERVEVLEAELGGLASAADGLLDVTMVFASAPNHRRLWDATKAARAALREVGR